MIAPRITADVSWRGMTDVPASGASVTILLHRLRAGDPEALDRLLPLVYDDLRVLARSQLRGERPSHTLDATALVHEAFLRLNQREQLEPADRHHFFAIAAQAMRRVLIDHARTRNRIKRGGGQQAVTLDENAFLSDEAADELLALDQALERLAAANERAARVVEQRFFAGLTLEETAEVLGVSLKTVQRDWILARAWLRKEIAGDPTLFEPPAPPA
ncbi:MAG: sigma-70 family RNA polymerase sigma factor [Longimicrobiales bacterium]